MPYNNPIPESRRPKDRPRRDSGGLATLVQAEKLMQIALVLPSAVLLCWLAGRWADQRFHQRWITVVGVLVGCVSGLVYVVQMAVAAEKAAASEGSSKRGGSEPGDE